MAGLLHATTGLFGGLNLKCKHSLRTSNGNTAKLCMKTSAPSYHVEVAKLALCSSAECFAWFCS